MPERFRNFQSKIGFGASLALDLFAWSIALGLLCYGAFLLPTLADWNAFLGQEGALSSGALRLRAGEWPYRDFLFLQGPGTLAFQALLQSWGASWVGERSLALLAAAGSAGLVLRETRAWVGSWRERMVLAALLVTWSFSLWNVSNPAWYAIFFLLMGLHLRGSSWILTGLFFAAAFWCKQDSSLAASLALSAFLLFQRQWKSLAIFGCTLGIGLLAGPLVLWLAGGNPLLAKAWEQMRFLASQEFLPGSFPEQAFGKPLTTMGLWLGTLYLSKAAPGTLRLARLGVIAFASYAITHDGKEYFAGLFALMTGVAWLGSLLFLLQEKSERRSEAALFWLLGLALLPTFYSRLDISHFLFLWPFTAPLLVWFFGRIPRRYPSTYKPWVFLPIWLLLVGGGMFQSRVLFSRLFGERDGLGWVTYGMAHQLDNELALVNKVLREQGMKDGDPLLVLGNAPSVYRATGFRNPGPNLQFLPGFVEAAGENPADVLLHFEGKGGHFVVIPADGILHTAYPEIERQLREHFEESRRFPLYFSVWKLRDAI